MILESKINKKVKRMSTITVDNINGFKTLFNSLKDNSIPNIANHMNMNENSVYDISRTIDNWRKLK